MVIIAVIYFLSIVKYDERCHGNPVTVSACCSIANQCQLGGGDCDNDSDCAGNLICGVNNCRRDFETNGTKWNWYDDCCTGT